MQISGSKVPKSAQNCQKAGFYSIGGTICSCPEGWCLPCAGFFVNTINGFVNRLLW